MDNHSNAKPERIEDDVVVTLQYNLLVNGELFESSGEEDPIEFIQGSGAIIPGLEKALYGLGIGAQKTVPVTAAEAYGDVDPEATLSVSRSEFTDDIPLEPGVELQVQNEEGEVLDATIVSVDGDTVQLDFNHPLAGKDLVFEIKVVDLRVATEEELAHGHVHGEDFDDDWDEDDDQ